MTPTTDMVEENRRLRRENAELRRVNEVLRAASAYFAAEIGPNPRHTAVAEDSFRLA